MTKRLCSAAGCNAVVEVAPSDRNPPRCPRHPAPHWTPKREYDHHYHNGKRIYSSPRWLAMRERQLSLFPLCEGHLKQGIYEPANTVDHIVEIEDGGDIWDPKNFQSLCTECHNRKTARERQKRNRKKKLNGFNLLSDF